ncbi:hypothetical protein LAWI1_G007555 [Lachnellula willkommii]|uniref:Uncharacterized protein n=1 Tax=Lachnellula willkommii TaxID=215461 RepID=A0A559M1Y9_9HELO|nr:hypothetical protein LAWI1_G007555 [Lachnellula willkommii]
MSDGEKQRNNVEEEEYDYGSESEQEQPEKAVSQPQQGQRTMQRARQQPQQQNFNPQQQQQANQQMVQQPPQQQDERVTGNMGGRTGAIRESRIKDRPVPDDPRESSLKIKIELDLEVEVDLYARVKGDVTIGLM